MSKILIVGGESGIGAAVARKLSVENSVTTTTRDLGTGSFVLHLEDKTTWQLPEQYDQVYYCIGVGTTDKTGKDRTGLEIYNINALLAVEFLDYVAGFVNPGGIVRIMSSMAGSISTVVQNPMNAVHFYYKMSKAALNMGVAVLHHKHHHVIWQLIHPGLVKTPMTNGVLDHLPGAIDPDTCADFLIDLPYKRHEQLQFFNFKGNTLGW